MGKIQIHRDFRRIFPSTLDRAYVQSMRHRHVNDIMRRIVVTIGPDGNMDEAARRMGEMRIGSLIVVEEAPVGIVTERDLITRVLARGMDPEGVEVKKVMSSPLVSIQPSATIKEAAQKMNEERKSRLAVIEEGGLRGIVTSSDLVQSLPEVPETLLKVDDYMTSPVETTEEDTPVSDVVKAMGEKRIGSIITTKGGQPEGIFTERDLLTRIISDDGRMDIPVKERASSPIIAALPGTTVHDAAYTMASKHIRRLPLAEGEELVGIVTARDLVAAYAK